jgi:putative nucleotidyltransferase with HDIG domain
MTTSARSNIQATPAVLSRPPASSAGFAIDEELWFGDDEDGSEEIAARSMAAMVGRILGAKPFPEAARQLEELTRGDSINIDKAVKVLERDPALSARLLRLVNSAGYALRMRCTSVRHAAALVGANRLHQVATTAAIFDMFDTQSQHASELAQHSAAVGALCRYLAVHFGLPRDELATCGFLHDIGKLMLLDADGVEYGKLLAVAGKEADRVHELERRELGFDHAVLGAHVLRAWSIPEPVPQVVAWHHSPARALRRGGQLANMVNVVRLADALAYVLAAPNAEGQIAAIAASESAQYLDISEPQLAAMWADLTALYAQSCSRSLDDGELAPRRASLEPASRRSVRSVEAPRHFPCAVCQKPSFGHTCTACAQTVCPEHLGGPNGWCSACMRDYREQAGPARDLSGQRRAWVAAAALTLGGVAAVSAWASGSGVTGILAAPVLAWIVGAVVGVAVMIAIPRIRFLRERRAEVPLLGLAEFDEILPDPFAEPSSWPEPGLAAPLPSSPEPVKAPTTPVVPFVAPEPMVLSLPRSRSLPVDAPSVPVSPPHPTRFDESDTFGRALLVNDRVRRSHSCQPRTHWQACSASFDASPRSRPTLPAPSSEAERSFAASTSVEPPPDSAPASSGEPNSRTDPHEAQTSAHAAGGESDVATAPTEPPPVPLDFPSLSAFEQWARQVAQTEVTTTISDPPDRAWH